MKKPTKPMPKKEMPMKPMPMHKEMHPTKTKKK